MGEWKEARLIKVEERLIKVNEKNKAVSLALSLLYKGIKHTAFDTHH